LDPHEAVVSSSFSDSSDNEGIPCSHFPCSTQPGGKFFFESFVSPSSIMKECSNNCHSTIHNRHFCSYYSMPSLPLIINHIKPHMTHKSHKAIHRTEPLAHVHFYSNIAFYSHILVTELSFIRSNFYITYNCMLDISVIFFSVSQQIVIFLML